MKSRPHTVKRSLLWWMASNMVWKLRFLNYPSKSIYCHFHLASCARMFYRDVTWHGVTFQFCQFYETLANHPPKLMGTYHDPQVAMILEEYDVHATSLRWLWCFHLYILCFCFHFHLFIHGKDVSFNSYFRAFLACWTCIRRTMLPRIFVTWSVQGPCSVGCAELGVNDFFLL